MLKVVDNIENMRWKIQKPKTDDEIEPFHVNTGHNSVQLRYLDCLLLTHPDTEGVFRTKIPNLQTSSSGPLF